MSESRFDAYDSELDGPQVMIDHGVGRVGAPVFEAKRVFWLIGEEWVHKGWLMPAVR